MTALVGETAVQSASFEVVFPSFIVWDTAASFKLVVVTVQPG
jgi:hypothetical protein